MAATLAPVPAQYYPNTNNTGAPAAGFKLFTYQAGTSTKQNTWTDSTQAVINANPLPLDANGFASASASASVWLDPTLIYKFVWAPANDTDPPSSPIRTIDNIRGPLDLATLTQVLIGLVLYPRTAAEIAASVTPINYWYPEGNVKRYGAAGDGSTDDTTALNNAFKLVGVDAWLPGGTYKVTTNLAVPVCSAIAGAGSEATSISCAVGITVGLQIGSATAATANLKSVSGLKITGNATASAIGLLVGSGGCPFCDITDVRVQSFTGTGAYGLQLGDAVGCTFRNFRCDSNTRGALFERISVGGDPTTCDFFGGGFRLSTNEGALFKAGASIRFWGTTFESNGTEGTKLIPSAGEGGTLEIIFNDCWWEGNNGNTGTLYHVVVDGTSDVARPTFNGGFWNGGARALHFTGANVRATVREPQTPNTANQIVIDTNAVVLLASFGDSQDYDTVVTDSANNAMAFNSHGLKFPATASASSNANCLDDYEEGTFTPTVVLGSGSVTYTSQSGSYTKIGRQVTVMLSIVINTVSAPAGSLQIGALPFTSASGALGAVAVFPSGWAAAATTALVGQVDSAATTIRIYKYAAGAVSNPGGDLQAASQIHVTATYTV